MKLFSATSIGTIFFAGLNLRVEVRFHCPAKPLRPSWKLYNRPDRQQKSTTFLVRHSTQYLILFGKPHF